MIFSVHDDGPGIDESQHDEVMQPFTRLDPSRNQNKGSGVGLGLPIAKEIAEGTRWNAKNYQIVYFKWFVRFFNNSNK